MKQPWEWEEEDIDALIHDGVQESITLDYKGSDSLEKKDSKKRELSKDVSSFANSAGGTLIYGVVEVGHLPVSIDYGFDPDDISREWVEQVINSNIQRRIEGVRIKQISIDNKHPGRVIYVVYVPQSDRAPHMASDNKYYKRFNYVSVPMEEYEVRDVSNRSGSPKLDYSLALLGRNPIELEFEGENNISKPIKIKGSIKNDSLIPAMYCILEILIDSRLNVSNTGGMKNIEGQEVLKVGDVEYTVSRLSYNFGGPGVLPIWENISFRLPTDNIEILLPRGKDDYYIMWILRSPKMTQKIGEYILRTGEQTATLDKLEIQVEN